MGTLIAGAAVAQDQACALDALLRNGGATARWPTIQDAWTAKYPASTLPTRMEAQFGLMCHACHNPGGFDSDGNCYRRDLAALIDGGSTVEDAMDALDGMDSDGDG